MHRKLKLFDILCLGVNAIVGSGIFLLPGRLSGEAGPSSILLFLICGLMLIPIGLCFAEAGSHVDRNGGPYNYAREAFGDTAGFSLGWIAVVTSILSYAAVANGLPQYASAFFPAASQGMMPNIIAGVVIAILTVLNILGVRMGANIVNFFTVSKLLPLLFIAGVGLFFIHPSAIVASKPTTFPALSALFLAVLFTYQGFEVVPVPAGEAINSQRTIPIAVMGSLLLSGLLYMVIQAVVVGSGAPVAGSERPLADTSAFLFGPWASQLLSSSAVISMIGYCAGIAFTAPRYLTVLCEDRFLPLIGARLHRRFETPYIASIFIAVTSFTLTMWLDFNKLVDMAAFAVALQYLFTCISVPRLRKRAALTGKSYIMPGKLLFPIMGAVISLIFLTQIKWMEFIWTAGAMVIGFIVSLAYRAIVSRGATVPYGAESEVAP